MAKKKILTIGFDICSESTEYCPFDSDLSLLDWDIVLFKPDIDRFYSYDYETYQGKPCFSESASFLLKEKVEHWRREIKAAVENGKSVVVYLSDLEEVFIDTGRRTYSGSGKNQITTRDVTHFDNYRSIPLELNPVKTNGTEIKLSAKNSELISTYWHEFSSYSGYKVLLKEEIPSCLITKHGGQACRSNRSLEELDWNLSFSSRYRFLFKNVC